MIVERHPQLDVPLMPTAASYIREMDVPVLLSVFSSLIPAKRLASANQRASTCTKLMTMKQWVFAVGKPNSMREGEKKKERK